MLCQYPDPRIRSQPIRHSPRSWLYLSYAQFAAVPMTPKSNSHHDTADGYLWAGKLAVYAKEMREAVDFQPTGDLSPDRTIHVHASNEPARTEFNYKYNDAKETTVTQKLAESCFNIIYDDMPLPGWWPWPEKYSNGAGTGDEYKSGNVGGGGSLI
ncbi:uncharacterized protein B0I36DRAFT_385076 [Microdochium trichocladiopsis]|uniref:Uncharacterized protein n=1 Tax=Microdochium trichocladiopsis TaxID=1682393 RepID=A0A9P8Y4M8_9PEZI|nr:uncharacterized protein B0I36DRAFT_385076 [Microdochium trichocladiopsis]KAH7029611.1 hypothetical protein B0I36DRAFT_385076 [Microdochium trichocladiopsis]